MLSGIGVFSPCYNEEGNLGNVVKALAPELAKVAERFEIVIVNDGSRDRIGEIADALAVASAYVKVIHHSTNLGYGAAVSSGLWACTEPCIVLCEGDGQFQAADIGRLTAKTPTYGVVIGRYARRADSFIRRINGKSWRLLIRPLLGVRVSDIDYGLKLFNGQLLEGLRLQATGAMISAELMAKLGRRGARICEVEVSHFFRVAGMQSWGSL
jgi:glycosyltransferase involved in cell wall biosynthesis